MAAIQRFFRPGQALFREGEPSKSLFLIKKGTVAIRKMKGAAFVEVARIYANEILGELSFFDRSPRSAGAVAVTEVEALEIDFVALDKIYSGVPDYMKAIMAAMADRLRKTSDLVQRLQKNVVDESQDTAALKEDEVDAEAILAASAALGPSGSSEGSGT